MDTNDDEEVVAQDVAADEFDRFCEAMDLDVDPKGMDDEDKQSFVEAKRRVLLAMRGGQLVIDEAGQPKFTPSDGKGSITFYEPTGANLLEMDKRKKNHDIAKTIAVMAGMTKQTPARFANMQRRDLKVCFAIAGLFLGG